MNWSKVRSHLQRNFTPANGCCVAIGLILATSLFSQLPIAAEKQDGLQPVRLMERRYRAAKTLQATFLERYTEDSRIVRAESGIAYFRRPGKMRWEYAAPERNLFLIDGKTAWFYVPADHTVTRVPAKQSGDWRTPLALLAGEMKVSRVCVRIEPASHERPEGAGNAVFTCTLRGSSASKISGAGKNSRDDKTSMAKGQEQESEAAAEGGTVLLEIGRDSGELARIVIRDKGGVGVEFQFAQWRDDPLIAEALFHFEVPQGVAIVNAELPAGPGTSE